MNDSLQPTNIRSLQLALHKDAGTDYLNEAAAMIRELAPVHRVRVDAYRFRLEILYRHPARGLLQEIHQALLSAGTQVTFLRAY